MVHLYLDPTGCCRDGPIQSFFSDRPQPIVAYFPKCFIFSEIFFKRIKKTVQIFFPNSFG